jgi:hypothetical protein
MSNLLLLALSLLAGSQVAVLTRLLSQNHLPSFGADPSTIRQVSFYRTGFGVPGSGRPFVFGNYVLLPGGEGDLTLCDITDKRDPRVVRYIPSYYFSSYIYPLPSRNRVYLSRSGGSPLLTLGPLDRLAMPTGLEANQEIKQVPWDSSWGPAFLAGLRRDGIAYNAARDGIVILDLNDAERPKGLARFPLPGLQGRGRPTDPEGLIFSPDYSLAAAVVDNGRSVQLLRWPKATTPALGGRFEMPSITDGQGKTAYGRVLAMDRQWLIIGHPAAASQYWRCRQISFWDIRDPDQPRQVSDYTFKDPSTNVRDLLLVGSRVYVLDGRNIRTSHTVPRTQRSRLYVLWIKPEGAPQLMATFEDTLPTEYSQMTYAEGMLYVNDYNFGLWVFDVSDLSKPAKLGGVPSAAEGHWLYLNGDYAYAAHTFGGAIHAINVADPKNPRLAGYYWDGQWLNNKAKIRGLGNAMYLPQVEGLAILDLTMPSRPVRVREFLDADGRPLTRPCLDVSGGYAFVATAPSPASQRPASPSRLLIYDLTRPLHPQLISTTELDGGKGFRVLASGDRLYLVGYGGGRILTVDARDPRRPRIQGDLNAPTASFGWKTLSLKIADEAGNGCPGVAFSRGYLYVTTGLPLEKSANPNPGDEQPYLLIFDVRDPNTIRPAGAFYVTDRKGWQYYSHDVMIQDDRLYLSDYGSQAVYELMDPLLLRPTARYSRSYAFQIGALRDGYLYVEKLDGLEILEMPRP